MNGSEFTRFIKLWSARITLLAFDILAILISLYASFKIRAFLQLIYKRIPKLIILHPMDFLLINWWILISYIVIFALEGLYTKKRPFWQEVQHMLRAILVTSLFTFSFISITKMHSNVSRLILIFQPIILIFILPIVRRVIKTILYNIGLWRTKAIEIKANTKRTSKKIFKVNKYLGYEIIDSFYIDLNESNTQDIDRFLKKIAKLHPKDLVFITKSSSLKNFSYFLERLYFLAGHIVIIPVTVGFDALNSDIYLLMHENYFVFDIKKTLNNRLNSLIKRIFDILISSTALILLSPIFLIVSLLILLKDGWPVFYVHKRYGKHGRLFNFYKFRTMYKDNDKLLNDYLATHPDRRKFWDKYQKLTLEEDPRIIKSIGKFLRKTSLDELPQLLNVLKGDMSLVGPRPYMPRERKKIGDYFNRILQVKPGITGLWQVSGRNDISFKGRLVMDVRYIQNWSMWLDVIILLKTGFKFITK